MVRIPACGSPRTDADSGRCGQTGPAKHGRAARRSGATRGDTAHPRARPSTVQIRLIREPRLAVEPAMVERCVSRCPAVGTTTVHSPLDVQTPMPRNSSAAPAARRSCSGAGPEAVRAHANARGASGRTAASHGDHCAQSASLVASSSRQSLRLRLPRPSVRAARCCIAAIMMEAGAPPRFRPIHHHEAQLGLTVASNAGPIPAFDSGEPKERT